MTTDPDEIVTIELPRAVAASTCTALAVLIAQTVVGLDLLNELPGNAADKSAAEAILSRLRQSYETITTVLGITEDNALNLSRAIEMAQRGEL